MIPNENHMIASLSKDKIVKFLNVNDENVLKRKQLKFSHKNHCNINILQNKQQGCDQLNPQKSVSEGVFLR